jgi:hypothetical protein
VVEQSTTPQQQLDPTKVLQMLLNQLAISGQLNLHQPTPSVGQQIGQIPPVTVQPNMQGSSGVWTSTAPNPQPKTLEGQPPETPLAEMQTIKQVSADLKSHVKQ